jgi:hypothetical protein
MPETPPIVTFYRMIEAARPPARADRSGRGSLPTRAFRHCDAVTTAAGFGWHIYPPTSFSLFFDGSRTVWTCPALEEWLPLGAAQFPDFAATFDRAAPADTTGYSPPFLTAIQEPGVVQVWTGLIGRTAPGWSLLVRAPANLPARAGCEPYEGVVETDHWFGPLFTNLRLTRTDHPIEFHADEPFLQVQPIPRIAYAETVLGGAELVPTLAAFTAADWADYQTTIVTPNQDPEHLPGRYAAAARRRRRCPHAGGTEALANAG